jgi:hypothetical protein
LEGVQNSQGAVDASGGDKTIDLFSLKVLRP